MSQHQPVLLTESIDALAINPEGIYIDGTYGRGGHSQALLDRLGDKGRLIAIDKDLAAIDDARQRFLDEPRFQIEHASYGDIVLICDKLSIKGQVDGILLDCGVSSPQLDESERGFSFNQDGPLDMRMNTQAGVDAKTWVNETAEQEMIDVFRRYGEERYAKRIAGAIVKARVESSFETTLQLAEVVKQAHPRWEKHKHPATRVFQAIRIEINNELTDLEQFLVDALDVLAIGGRLAIISFHSLEDRLVKHFMKQQEKGPVIPKEIPIMPEAYQAKLKRIYRKGIKASECEINQNVRARSAMLRVGEKLR